MSGKSKPWQDLWIAGEKLGSGGQGTAFPVTSISDPARRGVLKTLHNNKSEQARGRMYREVVALATLGKAGLKVPNVIEHNTDHYEDLSVPLYFVMDLIPGNNLSEEIKGRGPLQLDKAAGLCLDLCQTVRAAHLNSVLHRDLKPDNIIVRNFDNNDLVIVDYGLSFNQDDSEVLTLPSDQFRNRFLALPETNTPGGNLHDPRSDITALAGILYFCLTGQRPGHLQDSSNRPPHRRGNFSIRHVIGKDSRCEQVELLLDRAFIVEINSRFQTSDELIQRLQRVVHPVSQDEEDPREVAARLGKELRLRDRKTQLAEFKTLTQGILQTMQQYVGTIYKAFEPTFQVAMTPGMTVTQPFPNGIEDVGNNLTIQVTLRNHRHRRDITLGLGCRGQECVIIRCWVLHKNDGKSQPKAIPWEEIACFAPQTPPGNDLLKKYINGALNHTMKALVDEIPPA